MAKAESFDPDGIAKSARGTRLALTFSVVNLGARNRSLSWLQDVCECLFISREIHAIYSLGSLPERSEHSWFWSVNMLLYYHISYHQVVAKQVGDCDPSTS